MPNIDCLMDSISQQISSRSTEGPAWFSTLERKYTYSQIPLHADTAKHCNFNIVGGDTTGTTRFLTGFYGLTDMPAEFQKALDNTLFGTTNKYCFLDDILIVSKGKIETHMKSKYKCLEKFDKENFSVNLKKGHFAKSKIYWLGYKMTPTGIRPIVTKTEAIEALSHPKTYKQLKPFLGIVHHITKFVPNIAQLCHWGSQFCQLCQLLGYNKKCKEIELDRYASTLV